LNGFARTAVAFANKYSLGIIHCKGQYVVANSLQDFIQFFLI